jgi:hypothetical protein
VPESVAASDLLEVWLIDDFDPANTPTMEPIATS